MHSLAYIWMAVVGAAVYKKIVNQLYSIDIIVTQVWFCTTPWRLTCVIIQSSHCRNHSLSCTQLYMKWVQYGTTQSAIAGLNPVAYRLHYLKWHDVVAWQIMRQSSASIVTNGIEVIANASCWRWTHYTLVFGWCIYTYNQQSRQKYNSN